MMKGQTWVEFIVTTTIFLFAVAFLFFNAAGQTQSEVEKVQLQTSCLKAVGLENVFSQPGVPANWETGSNVTVFGLSNSNKTAISLAKWLKAKEWGFASISANATPASPWKISYKIYAFEPKSDAACTYGNAITICRGAGSLSITANSTSQATTKLNLFLPFSTATLGATTIEGDDIATTTSGNGTTISLLLHTTSSDEDAVAVTFVPQPNLIFIESLQIDSNQDIGFILGNNSAMDSLGARTIYQENLCAITVKKPIDFVNETALADVELRAW